MSRERDEGQAATELALVLPLLLLLALLLLQVALVARDQILVVHAAREAAREAAVDPRPASVKQAAIRASGLKPGGLGTELSLGGGSSIVTVRVEYRSPTDVVLIGPLLPDIVVGAKAAMRSEVGQPAVETPDAKKKEQEPRHRKANGASEGQYRGVPV